MKKKNNEDLVLNNINLIYYVLKKYNLYQQLEEYYDICVIGLVKAANNYDESKGYTFSTYGISCITSELFGYLRKEKNNKRKANYGTISLDTVVYDNNTSTQITLLDTLPSEINVEEEIILKEEKEELKEALKILNEKELIVISYMYGVNGCQEITQKEIAIKLKMQQGSVSRIGKRAINKMKCYLKINKGVKYE